MARQVASVHVDIARFAFEYSRVSAESPEKLVHARAKWIDDLVACLALRDPTLHPYGAFLLSEVEEYKKAEIERKKKEKSEKGKNRPADSADSENGLPRSDQTDQTDQTDQEKKDQDRAPRGLAQDILDHLNLKTGKAFRMGGATSKLIGARIKEGYRLEDFQRVIDNKVADWGRNPDYEQYLRPATLFQASKFDGYLNQKNAGPRRQSGFQRPSEDDRPDLDFLPTGTD